MPLKLDDEIKEPGFKFKADPLLSSNIDMPVYGLNFAIGYPLPKEFESDYHALKSNLQSLGSPLYVYEYEFTHITVMTLVNFNEHRNPTGEERQQILGLKDKIVDVTDLALRGLRRHSIKPFTLYFNTLRLTRNAAILEFDNPTGELALFRGTIGERLGGIPNLNLSIPKTIHSTIVRFYDSPIEQDLFLKEFCRATENINIGDLRVDNIILSSETKPYMRAGDVLHRFELETK